MSKYWGPMFPDGKGALIVRPPTVAEIDLGLVTSGGALVNAQLQALPAGAFGNLLNATITADAVDEPVVITETPTLVTMQVQSGVTTVSQLAAALDVGSTIGRLVGSWNPSDFIIGVADEFTDEPFTGGLPETIGWQSRYWDGHYPDSPSTTITPNVVPRQGPPGEATFVLSMDSGSKVTFIWRTTISPSESQKERRQSWLKHPVIKFDGGAMVVGHANTMEIRAHLAKFAALGNPFLLALPYEELTIMGPAVGAVVPVANTTRSDWANPGQRVAILSADGDQSESDLGILEVDTNSITLDKVPTSLARLGSRLMPAVPVLLDPTQGFSRSPHKETPTERWDVSGRQANFGYPRAPLPAEITISGTDSLDGLLLRSRTLGTSARIRLVTDAVGTIYSEISADLDGNVFLVVHVEPLEHTIGDLNDELDADGVVWLLGDYDPDTLLTNGDDFDLSLFGERDGQSADMGVGAEVATFDGKAIWDRGIDSDGTTGDSLQSLVEVKDFGGMPYSIGTATRPDWGRDVKIKSDDIGEWQWLKAFLFAVKGMWKTFWLPTMRRDLEPISIEPGTPAVKASLPLEEPVTFSGALSGVTIRARAGGAAGNGIRFAMDTGTLSDNGEVREEDSDVTVLFNDGDHVGLIVDNINATSTLVEAVITGPYDPEAELREIEDEFEFFDLEHGVDEIPGELVVSADYGDFGVWYDLHGYRMIQIAQETGLSYMKIVSEINNGDGTRTLGVVADVGAPPVEGDIESICWLERCRFEEDSIEITFDGANFAMQQSARVVQQ